MKCCSILAAILLFTARVAVGQVIKSAHLVKDAQCGEDGKVHIVYDGGVEKTIPPEPDQVGCGDVQVVDGGHTVGWSVLDANCCTSYPIPVAIVVLRDGKKTMIPSDQMVWDWQFVDGDQHLAILSGPTHGWPSAATLYDIRSGKRLALWYGNSAEPEWAAGWGKEFQN